MSAKKIPYQLVTELWFDTNMRVPKEEIKDVEDMFKRGMVGLPVEITYNDTTKQIHTWDTKNEHMTPENYFFPSVSTVLELSGVKGWMKNSEVKREDRFYYQTDLPPTLYDLMEELIKMVPEVVNRHDEIKAKIKGFIHSEKYSVYCKIKRDMEYMTHKPVDKDSSIMHFIKAKIETHGPEGWGNFQANLDWVKKYGQYSAPKN